jgi:hypothetical protein
VKLFVLAGMATLSGAALAVACSSSSNKGSPGGGGDGGGVTDGGGGGDGGSSSGGGGHPYAGTLTATRTGGTTEVYTISGAFVPTPDVSVPDASAAATCPTTGTVSGSCCYLPAVAASDAGTVDAGTVTFDSAGVISIKDGTTAVAALMPASNDGYAISSANNPSVKWNPGDTLAFSAAGATVDAFTGNLVTVVDFAGLSPALSLTTATTVPLASAFTLSWTPGTGTNVRLIVGAFDKTTEEGSITCDAADSAGTVTVPTALLSKFATGDTGVLTLTRSNVTTATDLNTTIDLISTTSTAGTLKFQ